MPKKNSGKIKRTTFWNQNITAPIKKGDVLGRVVVKVGNEELGQIEITAAEDVKKLDFWVTFGWIFSSIFKI